MDNFAYYDGDLTIYTTDMDSFVVRAADHPMGYHQTHVSRHIGNMYGRDSMIGLMGSYSTDTYIYTIRAYCMLNTSDFRTQKKILNVIS